ncbi:MAG: hypothetical protein WD101_00560 [Gemmatimonadota bacterium]
MTNDRHEDGRDPTVPGFVPEWVDAVRETYHAPPGAPREEMWAAIEAGMTAASGPGTGTDPAQDADVDGVIDLVGGRARREPRPGSARPRRLRSAAPWAVAAAALLVLGIGIGRWSAAGPLLPTGTANAPAGGTIAEAPAPDGSGLELAARMHFGRTESLLATVRSDARAGRVDGSVGPWARTLLAQTRLLMDARGETRDDVQQLLSDLELVLVQVLGATEASGMDEERAREELDLMIRSLERGEILPRIRSAAPSTMAGA